jgi:hypothetical protein
MRRTGKGSGGGIGMNKNVQPNVRTGAGSRSARPAGVAQIGQSQGSHVTANKDTTYRGEPLHNQRNFQPVKFGNEVALNVGPGGCGTGRTIYKTGTQTQHGGVAGTTKPTGRDILSDFGPDYRK